MSGAGSGFAGTVNGSFFEAPGWVDKSKPAGATKQVPPKWSAWFLNVMKVRHFLFSPNFVWFSIALFVYLVFPYDLEAAKTFRMDWIMKRLLVNLGVTWVYVGFWDVTLYGLQWSKRKFTPSRWPKWQEFLHNAWYMNLGILQWTAWEVFFIYAYASGRLPCIKDGDAFATIGNALTVVFFTLAVPIWRGFHFYFAHRFIHIRPMYRFVHSLHHRNTDIEPCAGLCMHPVEHLYYFSCIMPSLYLYLSPFHFAWNGWHLLLSPAASHSGWEDHMQSDQFHYLHHAKFECNYGSASLPLDNMFGTFVDVLQPSGECTDDAQIAGQMGKDQEGFEPELQSAAANHVISYTMTEVASHNSKDDCWVVIHGRVLDVTSFLPRHPGGERVLFALAGKDASQIFDKMNHPAGVIEKYASDTVIGILEGAAPPECGMKTPLLAHEAKTADGLKGTLLPTRDYVVYMSFTICIFVVLWLAIMQRFALHLYPYSVACLVSFGPLVFACVLCFAFGEKLDLRWPFQHESLFGKLGLHLVIGFLVGVVPVYHTLTTVLAEPPFCQFWDPSHMNLCAALG